MKNKYKKIIATISILATLHIPQAQATFSQGDAGAALTGLGASGVFLALAGGSALLATGGIPLAALGIALLINEQNGTSSTTANSPIVIQLNPNTPLVTPAGWTPPATGQKQPTPPNNETPSTVYRVATTPDSGADLPRTTKELACQAYVGQRIQSETILSAVNNNDTSCTMTTANRTRTPVGYNATNTCNTGYTYQSTGNTCALSNATLVKKPIKNKVEVVRTANEFTIDPQINPADIPPITQLEVTPTKVTAKSANGNKLETTINPDGTSQLKQTTINNTTNTTNITTTNFSAPDSNGNITTTGSTTNNYNGTGTAQDTTALPTTAPGTSPTLNLPTDYNRESTQQQIKTDITTIKDYLKCDDCELPAEETEENRTKITDEIKKSTGMLEKVDEDYSSFKDMGWSTWVPTFPSSTCTPLDGTIAGQNVSWDFCPHIANLNSLLGWLMNIFGAWTITGMFFRKE